MGSSAAVANCGQQEEHAGWYVDPVQRDRLGSHNQGFHRGLKFDTINDVQPHLLADTLRVSVHCESMISAFSADCAVNDVSDNVIWERLRDIGHGQINSSRVHPLSRANGIPECSTVVNGMDASTY
jgi:hypothetical protein